MNPDDLIKFILDPENGLLLDAHANPGNPAAFRLDSGRLQRYYILIASLFRDRECFDACADALGEIACTFSFSALASCTATAKHLMTQVHGRVQTCANNQHTPIAANYHGMYPLQGGRTLPKYGGQRVLMVCDVVHSGSLCVRLAEEIAATQGNVVAVLCLVATRPADGSPRRETILLNGKPVPLRSLCEITIPEIPNHQVSEDQIEQITPESLLRQIIADPNNGMLLDARDHHRRVSPRDTHIKNPAFLSTSGQYQRQFVTAWGLFDKPWFFEDCMERLADRAAKIRAEEGKWFSTIVTCSATGRHIMEHLQSRIETSDDPVRLHYLGPFPYHGLRHQDAELRDQPVLVVTDIVAKGRMIRNILDVVARLRGRPVAVLSLVGLVEAGNNAATMIEYGNSLGVEQRTVPASYLTIYPIEKVSACEKEYRIDPSTILPEEASPGTGYRPLILPREALTQFESSKALTAGLFQAGLRRVSVAIHLKRLFDRFGPSIWKSISNLFAEDSILVTTLSKEDGVFREFVEREAAGIGHSLESVFIPRSDSIDFDFPYFLTPSMKDRLSGGRVVLLLSSLQTSEKLRKLVALLAQSDVRHITVLCLLNRMGARTVKFVSRIQKMAQGLGGLGEEPESFEFQFKYVYELRDLHGEALRKTLETVDWMTSHYISSTTVQTYRSLTEQEVRRYWHTTPMTGYKFEARGPSEGEGVLELGGESLEYKTLDGRFFAMCSYLAQRRESGAVRDYLPVIRELPKEENRRMLYLMYAVLLSDVSYLRLSNKFGELRKTLIESIEISRAARLKLDADFIHGHHVDDQISGAVQRETYYMFGLALFCYMDEDRAPYIRFLKEALTCNMQRPEDWQFFPRNLELYYGNERVLWCLSLLAHQIGGPAKGPLREQLTEIARSYREAVKQLGANWNPEDNLQTKLKYVWDGFLTDLGAHEALQHHEIIRYLQGTLIEPRRNHILVIKDPNRALASLNHFILEKGCNLPETKSVPFPGPEFDWLKRSLEDAIHASATLEGVADALAKLFSFHTGAGTDAARYVAGINSPTPGFRKEVYDARRLLQKIRDDRAVTQAQLDKLNKLLQKIEGDLTVSDSVVLQALKWYIVPLQEKLKSAMAHADVYLEGNGLPPFWRDEALKLTGANYVLIEPTLLKDVLWNLFTNVRHGLDPNIPIGQQIQWSLTEESIVAPAPDSGKLDVVRLEIVTPLGKAGASILSDATIHRQQLAVGLYRGSLNFEEDHGKNRFLTTLTLLLRNHTHEAWCRSFDKF